MYINGQYSSLSLSLSPMVSAPSADTVGTSTSLDQTSSTLCLPSRPLVPLLVGSLCYKARLDDVCRHPLRLQGPPIVSLGPLLLSRLGVVVECG